MYHLCFDSFGHNAMQVIDNGYYGTHVRPLSTHSSCIWVSGLSSQVGASLAKLCVVLFLLQLVVC